MASPSNAESHPALSSNPIVEAAFEVRARAQGEWEPERITSLAASLLSHLPDQKPRFLHEGIVKLDPNSDTDSSFQRTWIGVEARDEQGKHIVFMESGRFVFSCLSPYPGWNHFNEELIRSWKAYADIAKPLEAQRVGLRFINRLPMNDGEAIADFIDFSPSVPFGRPVEPSEYVLREAFNSPDGRFTLSITRAVQQQHTKPGPSRNLIVDLDVGTIQPVSSPEDTIVGLLAEMQEIKNRAFFGTMTEHALAAYR